MKQDWISVEDELPELIDGRDYSRNVLAWCNDQLMVMCLCYIREDDGGYAWANCYGDIYGDGEFDDEYNVTHWMELPKEPK